MERFDFFDALHLREHLYSHTDDLSKDLQGTRCCQWTLPGKSRAAKKMSTDESFDHFYVNVACKSEGLLGEPTLPRKQRTPARLEVGAGAPSYPQTAISISALIRKASAPSPKPRWRPSWLKLLMVTTIIWGKVQFLKASYSKDVGDTGALPGRLLSMFWRNPVGSVKVSKTRKEAKPGSLNYL